MLAMTYPSSPASGGPRPEKTAAEKIEAFDRIAAIIADQRKLEQHHKKQELRMRQEGIRLSRNDAYREIVLWVTGEKIVI